MPPAINLEGQKFNRLLVLERTCSKDKRGSAYWRCLCDCGNIIEARGTHLRSGGVQSCGCLVKDTAHNLNLTHGDTNRRLFKIWTQMRNRCNNPNNYHYFLYGGRGITVCDEWEQDYNSFKTWSLEHGYDETLTIDRINNNGNYCPENCRWVSYKEQGNNRRTNKCLSYNNETHTLTEWAAITGINFATLQSRIKMNWDVEKVLTTPVRKYCRRMNFE